MPWFSRGPIVAIFGLISGFFGSVAGNQGGLRGAALTAFRLFGQVIGMAIGVLGVWLVLVAI